MTRRRGREKERLLASLEVRVKQYSRSGNKKELYKYGILRTHFACLAAMDGVQILGIFAGVTTSFSSIPQLIKVIKTKEAKDVSVKMLIVLIIGMALWIVYGYLRKDLPLLLTNSFSLLLNAILLGARIKYAKGEK